MIPRTAKRRLQTTLLASRQSLPRPARLYSTPTSKVNAPATAHAQIPNNQPFTPFYYPRQTQQQVAGELNTEQLSFFLQKTPLLTIIPTPSPAGLPDESSSRWFIDSKTQEMAGIIDACLHNLYDVPRAMDVFKRLREARSSVLEVPMYNAFLDAYLGMAKKAYGEHSGFWVEEAWTLYKDMENGSEEVVPNHRTYAIMLNIWQTFKTGTPAAITPDIAETPGYLLAKMEGRKISAATVTANLDESNPEASLDVVKALAVEAVKQGFKHVVSELTHNNDMVGEDEVYKDVPEVLPTKRIWKSGEVENEEVPFSIESLRRQLASLTLARKLLDQDRHVRQRQLETSGYELAVEQLEHQIKNHEEKGILDSNALLAHDIQAWMWEWHKQLQAKLKESIARIKGDKDATSLAVAPYLTLLKPEKLSLITIFEVMRIQGLGGGSTGMKMTRMLITVGKAVESEYKANMCRLNNIPYNASPTDGENATSPKMDPNRFFTDIGYKHLHQRRVAAAQMTEDGDSWTASWTPVIRSRVGAVLVEALMDVAQVIRTKTDPVTGKRLSEAQPAFYSAYDYVRGQKLGVLRLNPAVADRMAKDKVGRTVHPRHLPMLVPPKPWLNYDDGGYLYNKSSAMRFKDSYEQEIYLKQATAAGGVEMVYAGLDVLGSTPWKINRAIFDIVVQVWNSGERMGKMPPSSYDEPEPVLAEGDESDLEQKSNHILRHRQWLQHKANNHSDRCSVNYKVEIARAFLADTFYLPHNLDFRGRAYPIPPHLSHIGDDLSRGLLLFADAKPLGERGFRWLKIHLANLYGYDKANFDERVDWVDKHIDNILESAENPLEGTRWWLKADDPWQCLATCMELRNALALPDPTQYASALPVHQDGTCNGLQHYAALGGDEQGAMQVNLSASARPSDVYTHVGTAVEKIMEEEAEKGNEWAILLKGKISRKVVKQTVMTTVYGVTFVGAREQIEGQLRDRGDIPQERCWGAASYLAHKVLACIGDTFTGAKAIQTWLTLCARLISKSIPGDRLGLAAPASEATEDTAKPTIAHVLKSQVKKQQMTSVIWTTALGLPIVQPYRKVARKQIMTAVQSVFIADPYAPSEVNSVKQSSAFPPNFVHSLDATHMMLSALECKNRGLTFASVHDSYWTHACDIDKMSTIIRDTFIALHSSDVLGKLHAEFRERYKNYMIPIESLGVGSANLVKQLYDAGTRITARPDQVPSLRDLAPLVVTTDNGTTSVHDAIYVPEPVVEKKVKAKNSVVEEDEDAALSEESDDFDADQMDEEVKPKRKRKGNTGPRGGTVGNTTKFISLVDLLPVLPEKGTFKVEDIKQSPYFFS